MSSSKTSKAEERHVVMHNKLVEGKYSMPLQAAKIVRMAIAKMSYGDDSIGVFSCSIVELAELLGISKGNLYRDIRKTCATLERSFVYLGTDNPRHKWIRLQWVEKASYDGNGTLSVILSPDLQPYLIGLRNCYTQYRLKNIIGFDSFYAIRLYELLLCRYNMADYSNEEKFKFTIAEIRELLLCKDKFPRFPDFRRKVLERALREINDKSDIEISFDLEKNGISYSAIVFNVHLNKKADNQNSPLFHIQQKQQRSVS